MSHDASTSPKRDRTAGEHGNGKSSLQTCNRELLARIASASSTTAKPNRLSAWYRPVVAVPTSVFTSQYGRWRMQGVESDIERALCDAGMDAYFFPCRPVRRQENLFYAIWQVVRRADALLVPGGINEMLPGWFAQSDSSAPQTGISEWWEDWWRWHAAQLAVLVGMPYLGIDQGAGYLNVVLGGTLHQDMNLEVKSYGKHRARGALDSDRWVISPLEVIAPESRIASCANDEPHIWGACMHRQAVNKLAPDLIVTARSMDACPEVIERADSLFGMGLWNHPEQSDVYDTQQYPRNVFSMLSECAMTYASSQAGRHAGDLEARLDDIWSYLRSSASPRLMLAAGEAEGYRQAGEHEEVRSEGTTDAIHPV